jgi:O-acetyl-ADP-ribose deacetylase (regulator of RNase III)
VAGKITIIDGDITRLAVDAIVNAANRSLLGGGGVDGAIHRAAGPELLAECRNLGGCPTGEARITPGFRLPARYVIHTVGPVWNGGDHGEPELLARCYRSCFQLVREYGIKTIAFPAISTGVYGFPKKQAAAIAIAEIRQALADNPGIKEVLLVCFGPETRQAYETALEGQRND